MELLAFFQLYIREYELNPEMPFSLQFLLVLAPLLFNLAEYSMEFYRLVKKKTAVETLAVMQLPLGFALWGALFLSTGTSVPTGPGLYAFRLALSERETAWGLLLLSFACLLLMALARFLWNKRKLSYVTGSLQAVLVALPGLYLLIAGRSIFSDLPNLVLTCYLYIVLFLVCKLLMLVLGTLVCICTARIRKPVWHSRRNPVLFFWRYYALRQNAVFRGTILFWLPAILLYALMWSTGTVHYMDDTAREGFVTSTVIIALLGTAAILLSLLPACLAVRRLGRQGNLRAQAETFCLEYFQEDSRDTYTATLHFLVDEEAPAAVYSWSELCSCSGGWVSGKKGWSGILRFRDGRICEIPKENPQAKTLMELAGRHLGTDLYPEQAKEKTFGWAAGTAALPGRETFPLRYLGISVGVCMSFLAAVVLSSDTQAYLETAAQRAAFATNISGESADSGTDDGSGTENQPYDNNLETETKIKFSVLYEQVRYGDYSVFGEEYAETDEIEYIFRKCDVNGDGKDELVIRRQSQWNKFRETDPVVAVYSEEDTYAVPRLLSLDTEDSHYTLIDGHLTYCHPGASEPWGYARYTGCHFDSDWTLCEDETLLLFGFKNEEERVESGIWEQYPEISGPGAYFFRATPEGSHELMRPSQWWDAYERITGISYTESKSRPKWFSVYEYSVPCIFPIQVASNREFEVWLEGYDCLEDALYPCYNCYEELTQEQGDTIRLYFSVRDKQGNLLQELSCFAPYVDLNWVWWIETDFLGSFACFDDVTFDGKEDLLVSYASARHMMWDAFVWDEEEGLFREELSFSGLCEYQPDPEHRRLWSYDIGYEEYTVECWVYTPGKGFRCIGALHITTRWDDNDEIIDETYRELFFEDGIFVYETEDIPWEEVSDFWKENDL